MNRELALKLLSQIMSWTDERAQQEFHWLRLMGRLKYDDYRDFIAGARFVESLAVWLSQFKIGDRETAYRFVRDRLIFVGPIEIARLVERLYPATVRPRIVKAVSSSLGIPAYTIWSKDETIQAYDSALRKTLFLALSDGARIDHFRRTNVGVISNEQIIVATQVDSQKWKDILDNLRSDTGDPTAKFELVFLIDDFTASGKTLIRFDSKDGQWKGKLKKFRESIDSPFNPEDMKDGLIRDNLFHDDWVLCVHHYIATNNAAVAIKTAFDEAKRDLGENQWFRSGEFTFGNILPNEITVDETTDPNFWALTERYYDPSVENLHSAVGGDPNMRRGFGQCALPIVLEHNTPNNSIALLWADTDGEHGHPMKPLFRRRQRHT